MDNLIDVREQAFSFFGNNSEIEGVFKLKGRTHICSNIRGEITQLDNAVVIIEHTGNFEGKIVCKDLYIHGSLKGEINSTGTVRISSSAKVHGKVKAKNLVIEPGSEVNFEGHTVTQ